MKGIPFGYKNSWIIFKSTETKSIIESLKEFLEFQGEITWEQGLNKAYLGSFFLTLPIQGWTFLISSRCSEIKSRLLIKSKLFNEIHYYSTHRSSDFLEWEKYYEGKLIRAFSISDGEIIKDEGEVSDVEIQIAQKELNTTLENWTDDQEMIDYIRSKNILANLGDEDNIMELAGNWSINPLQMNTIDIDDTGYLFEANKM